MIQRRRSRPQPRKSRLVLIVTLIAVLSGGAAAYAAVFVIGNAQGVSKMMKR